MDEKKKEEEKESEEEEEEEEDDILERFPLVVQKLLNVLSIKIRSTCQENQKDLKEKNGNRQDKNECKTEKETLKEEGEETVNPKLLELEEAEKIEQENKMSDAELKQKMKLDLEALIEKQVQGQLTAS